MRRNILGKGLVCLIAAGLLFPLQIIAQDLSAREIMEELEDNRRATSNSALSRMQLSTCKFGVREGKITCAERPRVKSLESVGKGYGTDLRDTRSVAILLEPAAERGIGMLSFIYDDGARDNETWLYLSALGRVKRIASGSSDEEPDPGPGSSYGCT
ncbi:MAG: outer membrane lipoprotein-sorting protein [Gammaproteobacteria bacterium]|nr:outer membrane lipoprotein-sorting protein [Gammaproteobacteria bacterium]